MDQCFESIEFVAKNQDSSSAMRHDPRPNHHEHNMKGTPMPKTIQVGFQAYYKEYYHGYISVPENAN
jgi:hypothetical protein